MKSRYLASTALCAGLALSLAACNQNPSTSTTSSTSTTTSDTVAAVKDATAGAVGKVSDAITITTQGFVQAAAMSDMYEVQAGRIALMRSHSDDVKKFAQQMIDAHTGSTAALKKAIVDSNATVTTPTELDATHQGLINDLTSVSDADFDKRYISQQTAAHSDALTLFHNYAGHGDNPQIQAVAQTVEPVVQMHLDMAKMLGNANP